jgi:hypothetical protein
MWPVTRLLRAVVRWIREDIANASHLAGPRFARGAGLVHFMVADHDPAPSLGSRSNERRIR